MFEKYKKAQTVQEKVANLLLGEGLAIAHPHNPTRLKASDIVDIEVRPGDGYPTRYYIRWEWGSSYPYTKRRMQVDPYKELPAAEIIKRTKKFVEEAAKDLKAAEITRKQKAEKRRVAQEKTEKSKALIANIAAYLGVKDTYGTGHIYFDQAHISPVPVENKVRIEIKKTVSPALASKLARLLQDEE